MKNVTLVLGASINPDRYSNIVIKRLLEKEIQIAAIGIMKGTVSGVVIETEIKEARNMRSSDIEIKAFKNFLSKLVNS